MSSRQTSGQEQRISCVVCEQSLPPCPYGGEEEPSYFPTHEQAPKSYRIPIYRVALVREGSMSQLSRPQVRDASSVVATLVQYLDGADREHFVVVLLNSKNRIIGIHTVSVGSLNSTLVHPREVFKPALLANAAAILVAHNHPSGDPTPSREDIVITKRLHEAAELLGGRLLDHIVLGENGRWYSFLKSGQLGARS